MILWSVEQLPGMVYCSEKYPIFTQCWMCANIIVGHNNIWPGRRSSYCQSITALKKAAALPKKTHVACYSLDNSRGCVIDFYGTWQLAKFLGLAWHGLFVWAWWDLRMDISTSAMLFFTLPFLGMLLWTHVLRIICLIGFDDFQSIAEGLHVSFLLFSQDKARIVSYLKIHL